MFVNPVLTDDRGLDHGDPFVLEHEGVYYLYHTGRLGISLYTSTDLVDWIYRGQALEAPQQPDHWAQIDFWAPEVRYGQGCFLMYVAATRRQANGEGDDQLRRQGVARSASPMGPFVLDPHPLVDEWSIDGHPYRDPAGQDWFFYNIRTDATRYPDGTIGCGNVVQPMAAPDRLMGVQTRVAFPDARWEGNRQGSWYWNEGPFVLERRGVFYQMYSGGFFGDDTYGVGLAMAQQLPGPWQKHAANPILQSKGSIRGPGHHCVVRGPDGFTLYAVYHGYFEQQPGRKVHLDRLYWVGNRLEVAGPTAAGQPRPDQAVYDPQLPTWKASGWFEWQGSDHRCYLEWIQQPNAHRLRVDGVEVLRQQGSRPVPLAAEGWVVTSCLEDDGVYRLQSGQQQDWPWGGHLATEVWLAVKGQATVRAGEQERQVNAADFSLVRFWLPAGLGVLEVVAHGPVEVTDIHLVARSGDVLPN